MVMPAVKAQILNDLNQLSPPEQRRAAELVCPGEVPGDSRRDSTDVGEGASR
jgi:hypothetical protein